MPRGWSKGPNRPEQAVICTSLVLAVFSASAAFGVLQTSEASDRHGVHVTAQNSSDVSAPQSSPDSSGPPAAQLSNARSLLQSGKIDEAEVPVREYLRGHPHSPDAHFLLGYVLFRKTQADVVAALTEGAEHSPVASTEVKRRKEQSVRASLGEFTEGARYHAPGAFDLKVIAFDYVLLKDYPDADKWLTRSLQLNAKDSEGWYYLGRAKYNENRFEEAIAAFEQCLKLDRKSVKAEDNLGLSYEGLGRMQDANAAYHTAIAWQQHSLDQDSGPFINLGALLLDENQPQEAVTYLLEAAAISPESPRAHEHLGKAYERLDQLAKAQAEYEKAVELAPLEASFHYVLGQIYRKEGMTKKAKLEFDRSTALRESHASSEVPNR